MAQGFGHRASFGVWWVVLAAALAVWGCEAPPPPKPVPVAPAPLPEPVAETPASAAIRAHYAAVQESLLALGLLRTDMGGPDAPFTDRNLKDNFLRIAFYEEYASGQIASQRSETPIRLQRWSEPIRVGLRFGAAVPAAQVATDTVTVGSYLARLARVTGHPIKLDDHDPNFWLHIATVDERAAMAPVLQAEMPGLTEGQTRSVTAMDADTFCQVLTQSDEEHSTYQRAVAVIPSEHPSLLRLACIHEELAQALGLPNDSNAARPSIFNDDQEFALLTRQDELMLRILYDPALHPGMTEAEARPIVETLASRLMDGKS